MPPQTQTALVQSSSQQLVTSNSEPIPSLPSPHHVLVRVKAVGLNHNDHKMVAHFPLPGNGGGCDFCGVVEMIDEGVGSEPLNVDIRVGTRVCGTVFPYAPANEDFRRLGAFAEYVVADARLLLRIPEGWTDLQGAALGGVGWLTVALALSHPEALALPGLPSHPVENDEIMPILVYGGGTATGTMTCQLLKLSGYRPIAVTHSSMSAELALRYGAASLLPYTPTPTNSGDTILKVGDGKLIRHALDCITDAESAAFCLGTIARTGGRYACLEQFRNTWPRRRVVKVKEVMGYEVLGYDVDLGGAESVYTRESSPDAFAIGTRWAGEMQRLLDRGLVETHPIQEIPGRWDGVVEGLSMLQAGKVRGYKLVVRLSNDVA
ncbi:putative alcohol dehydrogenase [Hypoxylon trugodes]|uniref:putative alcohol dehydrogenase n=1 Tax=Hypoxylon trugodes TaxID=326681 RepID=UPI00219FBCFB|nr:putative alcohol dehydrogenase [Hypoxylon trugodes]KAI1392111.1 putative alcohol dehydrogenase [Hypoxylon trugodes]